MDVAKLLHALAFVVDVEIVIPRLPKPAILHREGAGEALLQSLDCFGERRAARLAQEKVNVIGHHYISIDPDLIRTSNTLQRKFEGMCCGLGSQQRLAMEATERSERNGDSA